MPRPRPSKPIRHSSSLEELIASAEREAAAAEAEAHVAATRLSRHKESSSWRYLRSHKESITTPRRRHGSEEECPEPSTTDSATTKTASPEPATPEKFLVDPRWSQLAWVEKQLSVMQPSGRLTPDVNARLDAQSCNSNSDGETRAHASSEGVALGERKRISHRLDFSHAEAMQQPPPPTAPLPDAAAPAMTAAAAASAAMVESARHRSLKVEASSTVAATPPPPVGASPPASSRGDNDRATERFWALGLRQQRRRRLALCALFVWVLCAVAARSSRQTRVTEASTFMSDANRRPPPAPVSFRLRAHRDSHSSLKLSRTRHAMETAAAVGIGALVHRMSVHPTAALATGTATTVAASAGARALLSSLAKRGSFGLALTIAQQLHRGVRASRAVSVATRGAPALRVTAKAATLASGLRLPARAWRTAVVKASPWAHAVRERVKRPNPAGGLLGALLGYLLAI